MLPGCTYIKGFIEPTKAVEYFKALSVLPWDQHIINMYGKQIPAPRKFVWMGTPPHKLYGKPVPVTEWTAETLELLLAVYAKTGVVYDSLNINMYRNQDDYLGWHIDPEDEGLWTFPIASISFGAERLFQVQPYTLDGRKRVRHGEVDGEVLESGSLLIMPPGFQGKYEHRLPKGKSKSGMRINLTFRKMER